MTMIWMLVLLLPLSSCLWLCCWFLPWWYFGTLRSTPRRRPEVSICGVCMHVCVYACVYVLVCKCVWLGIIKVKMFGGEWNVCSFHFLWFLSFWILCSNVSEFCAPLCTLFCLYCAFQNHHRCRRFINILLHYMTACGQPPITKMWIICRCKM